MRALLVLGFLLGVKHALEADHVAAVASLATRSSSLRDTVKVAGVWGIGHAATLFLFGSVMIALDTSMPDRLAGAFECAVGVMLIVLGADVLRRLRKERVHVHVHQHGDGMRHLHAHRHAEEVVHDAAHHEHGHHGSLLPRALLVGSLHGMAGSAALIVVALNTIRSGLRAFLYLGVFGAGSVLGMVLFSVAISLPLQQSARLPSRLVHGVEAALGVLSIALGVWIAGRSL